MAEKTKADQSEKVIIIEPRHEKTCLQGLRLDKTQTSLVSYRD